MAGDLEDFLKRAAERRQAKAAQQQQQSAPKRKPRPEYSDRSRERVVEAVEVIEEPLLAEVVDEHSMGLAQRRENIEAAKKLAAQVEAEAASKMKKAGQVSRSTQASSAARVSTGNMTDDLLQMMRSPDGLRQAILLREILERPEDRW